MTPINGLTVLDIERPTLAIVSLKTAVPMPRLILQQVFIIPSQLSPTKTYIRFGNVHGDEIVGWQPVDDVIIYEVFGECEEDAVPFIQKTSFPIALDKPK